MCIIAFEMWFPLTGRLAPRVITRSQERALWLVAICAVLAVWAYVFWAFRGQPGDDPFITYRYASNLASGNGFVFNPGERVQSTTTPLYALILAFGGLLGADIPSLGYLLSMLCLLAFAVCCVRLVSLYAGPWVGLAAVVLAFACPVTTYGLGGEMPLLIALAWGAWWAAASGRWYLCGLLAGLAMVTRGDGVLVAASIAVVYVAGNLRTPLTKWPLGAALLALLVAVPWYLFAWLYFGSPLPATLGAKVAQGSAPGTTLFLGGLAQFWSRAFDNLAIIWLPALVLVVLGAYRLARYGGWLAAPVVWALMFMAGFSLLHVPRYPWYYSPLVPVAALALLAGAVAILDFGFWILDYTKRFSRARWLANFEGPSESELTKSKVQNLKSRIALVACGVVLAVFLVADAQSARPEMSARSQMYVSTGEWLASNTPASASIGAEEVGLLGYYSKRRIVDFVGLIQPEVAPHRASGDNLWALTTYRPDYILALDPWLASVGQAGYVLGNYAVLRTFDGPSGEHATLLVRKP